MASDRESVINDSDEDSLLEQEIEETEFVDLPAEYREVAHQLTDENPNVFVGMNASQKIEVIKTFGLTSIKAMAHSGPLPDPESLARYNEIIPNGADRIMKMAENQQGHRFDIERKVVKGTNNQTTRGQWFALIIALILIGAAIFFGINKQPELAKSILITTLIGVVGLFISGKYLQKK